ncbi:MAG TPA: hypothetical protein VI365_10455, partial [Trebonia sp.]
MSNVVLASSPRRRSRRLWWILAYVVTVAGGLTTLAVDAHRFLYGATPVLRVGASPGPLVVSPDGRTIYLANSTDSITPVSAVTGKVGRSIPISGGSRVRASRAWRAPPLYLAMAPDGATVWVVSIQGYRDSTAENTVTPVSVSSGQPGTSFRTS